MSDSKQDFPESSGDAPPSRIGSLEERIRELECSLQLELLRNHQKIWRKNEEIDRERQRYANLFKLAPIGFLALNEKNQIMEANVASAVLLVRPSRNLAGVEFGSFVSPPDRDFLFACRKRARLHQKDSFELEMINSVGRHFFARLETVLTREPKWLIALADVTQYKSAERELTDKRDELQQICLRLRDERDQRLQAEEQLRKFSQKLIETQENERQRIARELHDQVGQLMTYLGLLLDKARFQLDPGIYRDAKSVAQEVLAQIRDLSSDLQPSMLRSVGLISSLRALFDRFGSVTGIRVEFSSAQDCTDVMGDSGLVAYRIVQEALTNIARHAGVSAATVDLAASDGKIRICIEDQGKGFDPRSQFECSGLTGMKERAQSIGGSLSICSAPGQGTTVIAELPVIKPKREESAERRVSND